MGNRASASVSVGDRQATEKGSSRGSGDLPSLSRLLPSLSTQRNSKVHPAGQCSGGALAARGDPGKFSVIQVDYLRRKDSGRFSNQQIFLDMMKMHERQSSKAVLGSPPRQGGRIRRKSSSAIIEVNSFEIKAAQHGADYNARRSFSNCEAGKRQAFRQLCIKATDVLTVDDAMQQPVELDLELLTLVRSALRKFFTHNVELFDSVQQIAMSMEKLELEPGEVLIQQGEEGHAMFIVSAGSLTCDIDGRLVAEKGEGDVVGEVALTYNVKRQATVTATTHCELYSLGRLRFQRLQARLHLNSRARIANFLRETRLLDKVSPYAVLKLADAMKRLDFADGEELFTEGQPLTSCLLLSTGTVAVSSPWLTSDALRQAFPLHTATPHAAHSGGVAGGAKLGMSLLECTEGCFLGQPVLLAAAGRAPEWTAGAGGGVTAAASARAVGQVKCWAFTLDLFQSLFGPVGHVLDHGSQDLFGSEERSVTDAAEQAVPMSMQDFKEVAFLGAGSFGRVTLAQCTNQTCPEHGQRFAIKTISKTKIACDNQGVQHINDERNLLRTLDHPFVLRLLTSFADRDCLYLVTSYRPSVSMWKLLYKQRLPAQRGPLAQFWAAGVAEALRYLHAGGVAYRDLKPENVLIDEQGYIILIDLGFSKKLPYAVEINCQSILHDRTYTLCGTVEYLAPEFLFDGRGHDHAVDLWAFGCLLYELNWGHTPFVKHVGDNDTEAIFKRICITKWNDVAFPDGFRQRANIPGVPDSGAACQRLVSQLLVCDTNYRLGNQKRGVQDILDHDYFAGIDWQSLVAGQVEAPWQPDSTQVRPQPNDGSFSKSQVDFPQYTGPDSHFADWDVDPALK